MVYLAHIGEYEGKTYCYKEKPTFYLSLIELRPEIIGTIFLLLTTFSALIRVIFNVG